MLPSPPSDDFSGNQRPQPYRKIPKSSKSINRTSKRTSPTQEHNTVVMDGRHKRVWKACERCRMKKTKCDGESPCKRCKDDGLVCTAGSRKKTEFKQLPRGYAEVLENTQYALIATVHKLYAMVRNNETWDLGEPEINERGQPVIHDIASRLGCIRPSPDLPYAFPEGKEDFVELQAQLQQGQLDLAGTPDAGSRKVNSSASSPGRTDRASSSESEHSDLSKDYQQNLWNQQFLQRQAAFKKLPPVNTNSTQRSSQFPSSKRSIPIEFDDDSAYSSRTSFDSTKSPPPMTFSTEYPSQHQHDPSPVFRNTSPFAPWADDEFLGQAHALDLTASYMKQQYSSMPPHSSPLANQAVGMDGLDFLDGTIRPGMLFDLEPMDSIMYTGEYGEGSGMI